MGRWFPSLILFACLPWTTNGEAPKVKKVLIGQLLVGLKGKPFAEVYVLGSEYFLVHVRTDWNKDPANRSKDRYAVIDKSGSTLASVTLQNTSNLYAMLDGRLLLDDDDGQLQILDRNLNVIEKIACSSKHCDENMHFSGHSSKEICFDESLQSCHWFNAAAEVPLEVFEGPRLAAEDSPIPAFTEVFAKSPMQAIIFNANEIWFIDAKGAVFYEDPGQAPKQISKWLPFSKENCGMEVSGGEDPRILVSCDEGVKIDFDDGIPLLQEVAVFDLHTHKTIFHRSVSSQDAESFLSNDGKTIGWVPHRGANIELEALP